MIQCPKCSSCSIRGPYYKRGFGVPDEWLEYICARCGYKAKRDTHDNRADLEHDSKMEQHMEAQEMEEEMRVGVDSGDEA